MLSRGYMHAHEVGGIRPIRTHLSCWFLLLLRSSKKEEDDFPLKIVGANLYIET
jgi:hypothetical protein